MTKNYNEKQNNSAHSEESKYRFLNFIINLLWTFQAKRLARLAVKAGLTLDQFTKAVVHRLKQRYIRDVDITEYTLEISPDSIATLVEGPKDSSVDLEANQLDKQAEEIMQGGTSLRYQMNRDEVARQRENISSKEDRAEDLDNEMDEKIRGNNVMLPVVDSRPLEKRGGPPLYRYSRALLVLLCVLVFVALSGEAYLNSTSFLNLTGVYVSKLTNAFKNNLVETLLALISAYIVAFVMCFIIKKIIDFFQSGFQKTDQRIRNITSTSLLTVSYFLIVYSLTSLRDVMTDNSGYMFLPLMILIGTLPVISVLIVNKVKESVRHEKDSIKARLAYQSSLEPQRRESDVLNELKSRTNQSISEAESKLLLAMSRLRNVEEEIINFYESKANKLRSQQHLKNLKIQKVLAAINLDILYYKYYYTKYNRQMMTYRKSA